LYSSNIEIWHEEDPGGSFIDEAFYPQVTDDWVDEDHNSIDGWNSISWTIRGGASQSTHPIDPILIQEICTANRTNIANRKIDNWDKIMPRLFAVYLWLKTKTENWTNNDSFTSFVDIFCECSPDTVKTSQWIDCVDILGESLFFSAISDYQTIFLLTVASYLHIAQQLREFSFCRCMLRAIHLLSNGFLNSSPIQPSTGFSMQLMQHHNYSWQLCNVQNLPFTEVQRRFGEERSYVLWDKKGIKVSHLPYSLIKAELGLITYTHLGKRSPKLLLFSSQCILGASIKDQKLS
jgi:hypothetical protein